MQRNISLDILKLVLSFFIIGLHCSFFAEYDKTVAFVLNQGVFRIGVPLFIIINGYFFFQVKTLSDYKKWLARILKLYLFWMAVYIPIWFSIDSTRSQLLSAFFVFNGYFQLWYIIHILYASLIFWKMKNWDARIQFVLAGALAVAGVLIQYIGNYWLSDTATPIGNLLDFTPIYRNFVFFCLPFFFIGYKINQHKITFTNFHLAAALILFFLEIGINAYYTSSNFDVFFSLFILGPVLFVKVRDVNRPSATKNVALVSSAVFLTHPLIMTLLDYFGVKKPTPLTLATFALSLILSFFVILLNKKLKFIL